MVNTSTRPPLASVRSGLVPVWLPIATSVECQEHAPPAPWCTPHKNSQGYAKLITAAGMPSPRPPALLQ
eukprot:6780888-Prymnesium_polylepis.2